MASLKAQPLLKFRAEAAELSSEGVTLVRELEGQICPIIFVGDGRSGKSYLASRLAGVEDAFVSSDSAESVTEGIDVVAVPVSKGSGKAAPGGEHLLILDCEGGNNALAAIRTLVNVFGLLLGSQVVFVANGMATEQALQTLGMSLAARSLVRLEEQSKLPEQELVFVVNKNSLRYEGSALDKILDQKFEDPGRQELRDTVRECFPERAFFTVPMLGTPTFDASLEALRSHLLQRRRPVAMGGVALGGRQLAGLMELVVAEVQKSEEISVPSMNRYVIYEGFLLPLANGLLEYAQSKMPKLDGYDPDLAKRNPVEDTLRKFDDSCSHIAYRELKAEARDMLSFKLRDLWHWVEAENEKLGDEVQDSVQEMREVEISRTKAVLGGKGLLKEVVVTKQLMREESRTLLHRKRGGEPECLPWKSLGTTLTRTQEWIFDSVPMLPKRRGQLLKSSPNTMRSWLKFLNKDRQPRVCILQDGHFMWWDAEGIALQEEAKGCINFLLHWAWIRQDPSVDTAFVIAPADGDGWQEPCSFTGDVYREFSFDAEGSEYSCSEWMSAIEEHVRFGALAAEQLGPELHWQIKVRKPMLQELEI